MRTNVRTDIETSPSFDIRFIEEMLRGQYDHIYFIFTTLENEPDDAWEDQGDSFLVINIPKEKVINGSIDYKAEMLRHLPRLFWLETEELASYINDRWRLTEVLDE
ncbi:hypothetical protein [Flavilitoribacter nigricans]|uniref:Uncharacterized protein n=1 Tax=Flavilitoribacter nigricans (strain ATCC 23147 / DSM 23189 / NBRC 102662 / NCIMB 1420 / SS-2) TaxID=1122177 RepID=A0A2D0NE65_FLAN2|nr:hypothetical protein [Flavilitoribacter nigricans]PHN06775.1 hypothetical protein CRP01_10820 [Flavilitoribacter nigricans DSM 23189 = NBRC 102662]